jgi:hypothetical protein
MSSPVSRSRAIVAFATLACLAACSYDFDRFAGSGGGAAGNAGAGSGGTDAGVDSGPTRDSAPADAVLTSDVDVRDAAVDTAVDDACVGSECGSCTNTTECSCASYNGHSYRFCTTALSWSAAETQCEIATMRLARVDDLFENAWIRSTADAHAMGESWIGVEDPMKTLHWQWPDGTQFWTGAASGSAVGGLYNDWDPGSPTGNSARNCASMTSTASSSRWHDRPCTTRLPYVCELY